MAESKRTPETVKAICQAIELGCTNRLAVYGAGIAESTFYQWLQEDSEFSECVKRAEGRMVRLRMRRIAKAGAGGAWQADAWALERRYPDQYGRTVQQQEHTGKDGGPIEILHVIGFGTENI